VLLSLWGYSPTLEAKAGFTLRTVYHVNVLTSGIKFETFRTANRFFEGFFVYFSLELGEVFWLKVVLRILKVIRYVCTQYISTLRWLIEMFIPSNFFDTHPAEENTTFWTDHFVASILLWYAELTIWALFCALLYIIQVELFFDLIFLRRFIFRFFIGIGDFYGRTPFEKVILLFASDTKLEAALSALTEIFDFVDLSRTATLF